MRAISLVAMTCLSLAIRAEEAPKPGADFPTLAEDGAWCWFADPRAVYHKGNEERTYVSWVKREKGIVAVASFDHRTGAVVTADIRPVQYDDHANPTLLVRPDGRLMIFYCGHFDGDQYFRTSTNPEDISAWSDERTIGSNVEGDCGNTYPNIAQLSAEQNRLHLLWRGADKLPTYATSVDGQSWSKARTIIHKEGSQRPYVKTWSNGIDTIHIAFTDGHPNEFQENSVYYVRYRNGALERADGSTAADMDHLPIEVTAGDKIYDGVLNKSPGWPWAIAADAMGNPIVIFAAFPTREDHRYHYARWNGTGWEDHEMTAAGGTIAAHDEPFYSGGMCLDTDPSTVFLSRPIEGQHEIESWHTDDGGESWKTTAITAHSAKKNVRPVVPRGAPPGGASLLWMYGDYPHFVEFQTAIKTRLIIKP